MGLFSAWNRWNKELCDRIIGRLPKDFSRSFLYLHELIVAEQMRARPHSVLLDIGSGGHTPFAAHRVPGRDVWLLGLDVAEHLLKENSSLDARVVADACAGIPFREGSRHHAVG
jgi:hypothetical protein